MGWTGLLESTHAVGRESRNLLGSLLFRSLLRVAVCPSVGIPKQRDRSSRRPSIDLLLVERVEGKACLSTKAEPRRCWSTTSLERRTKFCSRRHPSCATRPLRILRRLGRQLHNLGRRVAGLKSAASERDPVTRVDLDHDDRPKATRLFDRDVNVPWRRGRARRFRRLRTARGKAWRSTRFWCREETCCW